MVQSHISTSHKTAEKRTDFQNSRAIRRNTSNFYVFFLFADNALAYNLYRIYNGQKEMVDAFGRVSKNWIRFPFVVEMR